MKSVVACRQRRMVYQFVTVHGEQTNEKVTFRAYNTLTGEEFDIKETIRFGANVVGSLTNRYNLHWVGNRS